MREMDGMRITGPLDGKLTEHATSTSRELIGAGWLAIWPIKDRVPGDRYGPKRIGD